jgi:phage recombination protein Bet
MINNTLVKATPDSSIVEYRAGTETVSLSMQDIKAYLVSGGGAITDSEAYMFLNLCKHQHLNPFLREAYLIKYGNAPATMVTGKDVFVRRARASADFDGFQAGVIVSNKVSGEVTEREGSWWMPSTEALLGGWARVFIKGIKEPFYSAVSFNEYVGRDKDGNINKQWNSKPCTMIRKVALAQALREAFPDQNSGLYSPEEISEASNVELNENPVQISGKTTDTPVVERRPVESNPEPTPAPKAAETAVETGADAAAAALFGE